MSITYAVHLEDNTVLLISSTLEEMKENVFDFCDGIHARTGLKVRFFLPLGETEKPS